MNNFYFLCFFQFLLLILTYFWGLLAFGGPVGQIFGLGKLHKTFFGSIFIVDQLLFSMLPSILALNFDLILG